VSLFSAAAIGAQARQAGTSQDLQQIQSLMQQNRMAEAKTATLDVLHRDPKNVEAYNLLGMILGQQRDSAGAVASFQKALQIDPGSVKRSFAPFFASIPPIAMRTITSASS
jgi:Flp pilus assembly protein TadD